MGLNRYFQASQLSFTAVYIVDVSLLGCHYKLKFHYTYLVGDLFKTCLKRVFDQVSDIF